MTAVDWLANEFYEKLEVKGDGALFNDLVNQAKEMERKQIFESWDNGFDNGNYYGKYNENCEINCGEQYYNETFNLSQQDKP